MTTSQSTSTRDNIITSGGNIKLFTVCKGFFTSTSIIKVFVSYFQNLNIREEHCIDDFRKYKTLNHEKELNGGRKGTAKWKK